MKHESLKLSIFNQLEFYIDARSSGTRLVWLRVLWLCVITCVKCVLFLNFQYNLLSEWVDRKYPTLQFRDQRTTHYAIDILFTNGQY